MKRQAHGLFLLVFLIMLTLGQARAQSTLSSSQGGIGYTYSGNTATGNLLGQGTQPATTPMPGATPFRGGGLGNGPGGPTFGGRTTGPIPGLPGKGSPLDLIGKIPKESAGRALWKFAKKAGPLGQAAAFMELFNALSEIPGGPFDGATAEQKPDGTVDTFKKGQQTITCSPPMAEPRPEERGSWTCRQIGAKFYWGWWVANYFGTGPPSWAGYQEAGAGTVVVTKEAMTEQEFIDKIASESGWPTSGTLAQVAQQALTDALTKGGQSVQVEAPTVTGPASVVHPAKTETTTSPAGNTTIVTNQTTNITYNNNVATYNTVSNTTKTNPDGTTETTAKDETPDEETAPTDTALGKVPKLYERVYPDGITGVWNEKIIQLKASPIFSLASALMPSIAPGGTCPSWQIPMNVGLHDFGTFDPSPPCIVWEFGAWVVIFSALLLARALIFGG